MGNIVGTFLGVTLLAMIVGLVIGIAIWLFFQWLALVIGMAIVKIENKKEFSKLYLGRVILVGFLISILSGIANSIPYVGAIISCLVVYFCHYKITFKDEDERIKKGMAVFYTVLSIVPNILVSLGVLTYVAAIFASLFA